MMNKNAAKFPLSRHFVHISLLFSYLTALAAPAPELAAAALAAAAPVAAAMTADVSSTRPRTDCSAQYWAALQTNEGERRKGRRGA